MNFEQYQIRQKGDFAMPKGHELRIHYLDPKQDGIPKFVYVWLESRTPGKFYPLESRDDGYGGRVAEISLEELFRFYELRDDNEFIRERLKGNGIRIGYLICPSKDGCSQSVKHSSEVDWLKKEGRWNGWDADGRDIIEDRFLEVTAGALKEDGSLDFYLVPNKDPLKLAPKQKPRFVEFHYKRRKLENGWKLHVSSGTQPGIDFAFVEDTQNPGYLVARVPVEFFGQDPHKLRFKVHKPDIYGGWGEEDISIRRSIPVDGSELRPGLEFDANGVLRVFLREKKEKVLFKRPALKHAVIYLHYHRNMGDYDGCQVEYWLNKESHMASRSTGFIVDDRDSNYGILRIELDYEEGDTLCMFLTKKVDRGGKTVVEEDGYTENISLREGVMDLYAVQHKRKLSKDRAKMDALVHNQRILLAKIGKKPDGDQHYNTIYVEFSKSVSDEDMRNIRLFDRTRSGQMDEIRDIIERVEYTDYTRRRLKIILKRDLTPFETKYSILVNGVGEPKPVSLLALFRPDRIDSSKNKFAEEFTYTGDDLGTNYNQQSGTTSFRFWRPMADSVDVLIYDNDSAGTPTQVIPMQADANGTWIAPNVEGLLRKFYTYRIKADGKIKEVMDPYAKAAGLNAKRAAIIDLKSTNPEGWESHERPPRSPKPIIYEVSVRDFTGSVYSGVGEEERGKFTGFRRKIAYLKALGVNAIQLMPSTKFNTDESKPNGGQYNWGYDQNGLWFLLEGSYSSNPSDPGARIREFKELVKICHENGIRVILDVVYNHTGASDFNRILKSYYYRQRWDDTPSNDTGFGYGIATERTMVRKIIIDSLIYLQKEFQLDGFRFDVMSNIDSFTMRDIRRALPRDVLIYGEGFEQENSDLRRYGEEFTSTRANISHQNLEDIGVFADPESAIAIRNFNERPGLATGACPSDEMLELYRCGVRGQIRGTNFGRANEPSQAYSYFNIHDFGLVVDQLKLPNSGVDKETRIVMHKLCIAMLFNRLGPVVIRSGDECMSTKHGDFNSYKTEGPYESVNFFNWKRLAKEKSRPIMDYMAQYIRFVSNHPAYAMNRAMADGTDGKEAKLQILPSGDKYIMKILFTNDTNRDIFKKIFVIINLAHCEKKVNIGSEQGEWAVVGDSMGISNTRIGNPCTEKIIIPPHTCLVLADNASVEAEMRRTGERQIDRPIGRQAPVEALSRMYSAWTMVRRQGLLDSLPTREDVDHRIMGNRRQEQPLSGPPSPTREDVDRIMGSTQQSHSPTI